MSFQLTASRRGWRHVKCKLCCLNIFQLTASRRGWRWSSDWFLYHKIISTHSLTKRLTSEDFENAISGVFQLTASRRGWPLEIMRFTILHLNFNSQPHEEADYFPAGISSPIIYFNSQPHEEADYLTGYLIKKPTIFQLTASRRGWQRCADHKGS